MAIITFLIIGWILNWLHEVMQFIFDKVRIAGFVLSKFAYPLFIHKSDCSCKIKKLVQIKVPLLKSCEPRQC